MTDHSDGKMMEVAYLREELSRERKAREAAEKYLAYFQEHELGRDALTEIKRILEGE